MLFWEGFLKVALTMLPFKFAGEISSTIMREIDKAGVKKVFTL